MKYFIIAGSRNYSPERAHALLSDLLNKEIIKNPKNITIVSGESGNVDLTAKAIALQNAAKGVKYMPFEANWKKYGKAAGPRRNALMHATIDDKKKSRDTVTCVCLWANNSKGTAYNFGLARAYNEKLIVFDENGKQIRISKEETPVFFETPGMRYSDDPESPDYNKTASQAISNFFMTQLQPLTKIPLWRVPHKGQSLDELRRRLAPYKGVIYAYNDQTEYALNYLTDDSIVITPSRVYTALEYIDRLHADEFIRDYKDCPSANAIKALNELARKWGMTEYDIEKEYDPTSVLEYLGHEQEISYFDQDTQQFESRNRKASFRCKERSCNNRRYTGIDKDEYDLNRRAVEAMEKWALTLSQRDRDFFMDYDSDDAMTVKAGIRKIQKCPCCGRRFPMIHIRCDYCHVPNEDSPLAEKPFWYEDETAAVIGDFVDDLIERLDNEA